MVRIALTLPLLLLVVACALFWLFRVPLVEKSFSKATQTTVHVKNVEVGLCTLTLIDLKMEREGVELLSSEKTSLTFNPLSLFQKTIKIDELRLENPIISKPQIAPTQNPDLHSKRRFVVHHFQVINLQDSAGKERLPLFEVYGIGLRAPLTPAALTSDLLKRLSKASTSNRLNLKTVSQKGTSLLDDLRAKAFEGYRWSTDKLKEAAGLLKGFCKN